MGEPFRLRVSVELGNVLPMVVDRTEQDGAKKAACPHFGREVHELQRLGVARRRPDAVVPDQSGDQAGVLLLKLFNNWRERIRDRADAERAAGVHEEGDEAPTPSGTVCWGSVDEGLTHELADFRTSRQGASVDRCRRVLGASGI